jgi:hypothetical protein
MVVAAGTDAGAGEIIRPVVVEKCRLVAQPKLRTGIGGSRGVQLLSTTEQQKSDWRGSST